MRSQGSTYKFCLTLGILPPPPDESRVAPNSSFCLISYLIAWLVAARIFLCPLPALQACRNAIPILIACAICFFRTSDRATSTRVLDCNRCAFSSSLSRLFWLTAWRLICAWAPCGVLSHKSRSPLMAITALRCLPRGRRTGKSRSRSHRWTVLTPRPMYVAISFHEFRTSPFVMEHPF